MTEPTLIRIDAVVHQVERPAFVAAGEQLSDCLSVAIGKPWPLQLRFLPAVTAIDPQNPPHVVIASLLSEMAQQGEPWPQVESRWRQHCTWLAEHGPSAVFLCTVFRHLPERGAFASLERIRHLNLLAAQLSQETGVSVVDVDRTLSHLGARGLQTDYRLGGKLAAEAAGYAIVTALLAIGLDEIVTPEVQERAKILLGPLSQVGTLIARRLQAKG